MFEIQEGKLIHGDTVLGPVSALFVDSAELLPLKEKHGIVRLQMPYRIDMVFVAGEKVVGVESKKPDDLVSSTLNRRLARQIRVLMREVDIAVLLLKGGLPSFTDIDPGVIHNLINLQRLGVLIYPVPTRAERVLEYLRELKIRLTSDRSALAAVAGTDRAKPKQLSLLQLVKGVGPASEQKLLKQFGGLYEVLTADEDSLVKAGLKRSIAQGLRNLVDASIIRESKGEESEHAN